MNEYELRSILTRLAAIEARQRNIFDSLSEKRLRERAVAAPLANPVLLGGGGAAPTNALAAGAVTENREWAYLYYSSSLNRWTSISVTSTANLVGQQNSLTGPRSTDPQVDYVDVVTRLVGTDGEAWYRVARTENPAAGTWGPVVDNEGIAAYTGNPQALTIKVPVFLACGVGYRFRRAKVRFNEDLASNATNYWSFWLELVHDQQTNPYWRTPVQRTTTVGFLKDSLYPVPLQGATIGKPTDDFNLSIEENDLLVFGGQGVGAVAPLPAGTILVTLTEPEV